MVNVSHYGYNRRTMLQIFRCIIFVLFHIQLGFSIHKFYFKSKVAGYQLNGFGIQTLVDTYHHADCKTGRNYLGYRNIHQACQVVGREEFGNFYNFALFLKPFPGLVALKCTGFFALGFKLLFQTTGLSGTAEFAHGGFHFIANIFLRYFGFGISLFLLFGDSFFFFDFILNGHFFATYFFAFALAFFTQIIAGFICQIFYATWRVFWQFNFTQHLRS